MQTQRRKRSHILPGFHNALALFFFFFLYLMALGNVSFTPYLFIYYL